MGSSNKYCNNNHIKSTWNIFLHYTISTLARLDVILSNSKDYNNSYILRKSIPIHPIWNNIETTSTTKNSTIYDIIYKKQIIPYIQNKNKNIIKYTIQFLKLLHNNKENIRNNYHVPNDIIPNYNDFLLLQETLCNWDDIQIKINIEKLFWIYLNDFIHYIDKNEIVYNNIMEKYKKYLIKKKIKS